ncbi:hypothetical protein SAMN02927924_03923 [Sphingobium faniae]|nr:hypothetical protein SAMN02927924_03923 [Sphingobium faniae]
MMVMSGIWLRAGQVSAIGCGRGIAMIAIIVRIENYEAERQMFVLGARTARMLETINSAG